MAESIDFESEESFTAKVETLKESYFSKKTKESIVEEADEGEAETAEISDSMAQYVQALRKTTK